ncbi:MAG: DnaB-like helicase C-terminal domain-containing protein [Acidimicrobiales bacterium]
MSSLLGQLRTGEFESLGIQAIGTGFEPLDSVLDGGFLPGEVILLGGQPGAGKTICALQWARTIASAGRRTAFACFEHDEATLLTRLLVQEAAGLATDHNPIERFEARTIIRDLFLGLITIEDAVAGSSLVEEAMEAMDEFSSNLQLLRASSQRTTPIALNALSAEGLEAGGVLFVDYLQKLPIPEVANLEERVYRAVEVLKELAIDHQVTVVALSAAAGTGIGVDRLRLEHLRGSDALAHECDVAILMNQKVTATSDRHLKFDLTQLDEARRRTVFSIEKNRRGEVDLHLEFEKDFANFRFMPDGAFVTETLEGDQ